VTGSGGGGGTDASTTSRLAETARVSAGAGHVLPADCRRHVLRPKMIRRWNRATLSRRKRLRRLLIRARRLVRKGWGSQRARFHDG